MQIYIVCVLLTFHFLCFLCLTAHEQAAKHATTNIAAADEITRNLERLSRRTREDADDGAADHQQSSRYGSSSVGAPMSDLELIRMGTSSSSSSSSSFSQQQPPKPKAAPAPAAPPAAVATAMPAPAGWRPPPPPAQAPTLQAPPPQQSVVTPAPPPAAVPPPPAMHPDRLRVRVLCFDRHPSCFD